MAQDVAPIAVPSRDGPESLPPTGGSAERMAEVTKSYLSTKPIPSRERLVFALDVSSRDEAEKLVDELGESVAFYKLGLQLFMAGGYLELVRWLRQRDKSVFVDLKFFDVPETVSKAVSQLKNWDASFATVHGNDEMLKAAVSQKNGIKILAVTVLTSLDDADMKDLGFQVSIRDVVLSRAKRALRLGCDGVISSGQEAPGLREELGDRFLIVTPGIRPGANTDDQKRTVDVEEAFHNGADYIVVGRPIAKAADRRQAAEGIQRRIAALFPGT
jgi:orotidine-5'-phosphate decarboxylase